MGGSQSTRRVTVVNQTNQDVISVTDDVVERLNSADGQSTSQQQKQQQQAAPVANGYPTYSEMSGRSHQQDMDKLDQEWRARLHDLEQQNNQLYKLATDKFTGTTIDVHSEYVKDCHQPVCQNTQTAVLDCYKKNTKQPLQCSREVHAFQNCVNAVRPKLTA